MSAEPTLKLILRIIGSSSLFATIFVVAPHSVMSEIHSALRMGTLPDMPVVGYLARSTSALYAIVGGLFWVLSFDLPRYRTIVTYLGCAITLFGAALLIVGQTEGMPRFWVVWEGPFVMALGLALLILSRRIVAPGARSIPSPSDS